MALVDLDLHPDRRRLRAFGIGGLVFFAALAMFGHAVWGWPAAVWVPLLALAVVTGVLAIVRPAWNRPLYLVLTILAFPVGVVVSYVVLSVLWYVVLTPVGLLFRLLGRDTLRRRRPTDARSYWVERAGTPPPERYFRQF